jgi:hypothetical protein
MEEGEKVRVGARRRNDLNNVCTCELMNNKKFKNVSLLSVVHLFMF